MELPALLRQPILTIEKRLTRISSGSVFSMLLLAVAALLVIYPLIMLIYGSLRDSPPGMGGSFTLSGYVEAFSSISTYSVFLSTVVLAFVRTALAICLAVLFSWIIARTNTPMKGVLESLLVFMFFLPPLPWVLSWTLLASPKTGLLNQLLVWALPISSPPLNIYSWVGLIVLGVASTTPILYLFVSPAFKAMDASLEESSRTSGASTLGTFVRINLPLLAPAILASWALSFVRSMESFEIEQLVGAPAGIFVFTTKIYDYINSFLPPRYPPAMALSMLLLVLTFTIVVLQWRLLGARQYVTVTGRGYQARPIDLGRWRWVTFSLILGFFLIFTLLPIGVLILNSFSLVSGFYGWELLTLDNYRRAFSTGTTMDALRNTVIMSTASATIGMVLSSLIAYVVVRTRFALRKVLDLAAWIPWTVPGIVMALGFFWAFLLIPLPFGLSLYGTIWLMILVFVARAFPIGTRTMTSTMIQIGNDLEESSRVHGATWTQTFVRVWIPLVRHGFIGGWIILFIIAARNLDTVVLLYGPGSKVLSTEILTFFGGGRVEAALVVGLLQTALVTVAYVAARVLGRTGPQ